MPLLPPIPDVSIHAPTRGATGFPYQFFASSIVSIHAPTRGATSYILIKLDSYLFQSTHPHGVRPTRNACTTSSGCFNPRTHTGCDPHARRAARAGAVSIHAPTRGATPGEKQRPKQSDVSIHAPTRGATRSNLMQCADLYSFNPRTHTGCDGFRAQHITKHFMFQSTHPHGVRHPRRQDTLRGEGVSIHAPTRGATLSVYCFQLRGVFQSTHPHGVRPAPC